MFVGSLGPLLDLFMVDKEVGHSYEVLKVCLFASLSLYSTYLKWTRRSAIQVRS